MIKLKTYATIGYVQFMDSDKGLFSKEMIGYIKPNILQNILDKEKFETILLERAPKYSYTYWLNDEHTIIIISMKNEEEDNLVYVSLCYIIGVSTPSVVERFRSLLAAVVHAEKDKPPNISLIVKNNNYFETVEVEINKMEEEKFLPNYEGVPHTEIVSHLSKNKGIILLYGEPGTGKTTYIKMLANLLKDKKKFVYVPSNLIDSLTDPSLIPILGEMQKSVLIIEDAERALMSREKDINSVVTTLLNISDGIFSDMFQIQIICTFNGEFKNLDKAILRKGRLLGKYEFKKLSASKVTEITQGKFNETMTLADIYG